MALRGPDTRQTLAAGVVGSLLLHAAGVGTFAYVGSHEVIAASAYESQLLLPESADQEEPDKSASSKAEEPPPPVPEPPEPKMSEEERVKLGIDRKDDPKIDTWMGFENPTEHKAREGGVDQPALAIAPGNPGEPVESDAAPMAPTLSEGENSGSPGAEPGSQEQEPQPEDQQLLERQPEKMQPLPQQPLDQQLLPQQPMPEQPEAVVDAASSDGVELPPQQLLPMQVLAEQPLALQPLEYQPVEEQPLMLRPLPQAMERDEVSEDTTNGAARPKPPADSAMPGEKSEAEVWASAVVGSLDYKPGHPLATKGLAINTVAARWSTTTRLTTRPNDAVVRIKFGRNGRVLHAEFVEGKTTGYADVDGPLIDSVYRWTAKGKLLEKVPADDPAAGLTFDIKFLLK